MDPLKEENRDSPRICDKCNEQCDYSHVYDAVNDELICTYCFYKQLIEEQKNETAKV